MNCKSKERKNVTSSLIAAIVSVDADVKKNIGVIGWHSVGRIEIPTWDGEALLFSGDDGTLAITTLSDDVVRIHFTQEKSFKLDHSCAVVRRDLGKVNLFIAINSDFTTLKTQSLQSIHST